MKRPSNTRLYKTTLAHIKATQPRCALCGKHGANTIDHITPTNKGGPNTPDNWQPAHQQCNSSKADRTHTKEPHPW